MHRLRLSASETVPDGDHRGGTGGTEATELASAAANASTVRVDTRRCRARTRIQNSLHLADAHLPHVEGLVGDVDRTAGHGRVPVRVGCRISDFCRNHGKFQSFLALVVQYTRSVL
jgi:hypothetical protein